MASPRTYLLAFLLCGKAFAEVPLEPAKVIVPNESIHGTTGIAYTLPHTTVTAVESLSMSTEKGPLVIHLKTGKVDLPKGLELDAASAAFWQAVIKAFPDVRRSILEQAIERIAEDRK